MGQVRFRNQRKFKRERERERERERLKDFLRFEPRHISEYGSNEIQKSKNFQERLKDFQKSKEFQESRRKGRGDTVISESYLSRGDISKLSNSAGLKYSKQDHFPGNLTFSGI
jgi:hypothetical protein